MPIGRLAIVACLPVIVLFGVSFARVLVVDYSVHQQKAQLQRQIADLQQENTRLKREVDYLNTDTGLELQAREELGWIRPDDVAVVVVPSAAVPASPTVVRAGPTATPPRRS